MTLRPRRADFGEADRVALSRILGDPVFQRAASIALHELIPPAHSLRHAADATHSAVGNQVTGARALLDGLDGLAQPEPEAPSEGHEPWDHITEERETFDTHL